MADPRVSVCVPLYNKAKTVERCLGTVLGSGGAGLEGGEGMEVVVFDNGSTDGSSEIVAKMAAADARVRHVRLEHTIMVQESWRMAFLHGRGELLKLHSADDELHPEFWAKMLPPLDDPAVDFTMCAEEMRVEGSPAINVGSFREAFEQINAICRRVLSETQLPARARCLALSCGAANNLGNVYKVVLRRTCLPLERWRAVTPAYPMPTSYPDWDFLVRLVLHHRGRFVEEVLSRYWITEEAPVSRLTSDAALRVADAHQFMLLVLTVLADPALADLRGALVRTEIQALHGEAQQRLTAAVNLALALPRRGG